MRGKNRDFSSAMFQVQKVHWFIHNLPLPIILSYIACHCTDMCLCTYPINKQTSTQKTRFWKIQLQKGFETHSFHSSSWKGLTPFLTLFSCIVWTLCYSFWWNIKHIYEGKDQVRLYNFNNLLIPHYCNCTVSVGKDAKRTTKPPCIFA